MVLANSLFRVYKLDDSGYIRIAAPTLRRGSRPGGPAGTVLSSRADLADGTAATVVQLRRRAVVVLSASFDPDWTATIDGRPAPIQMVAPALPAVAVPPGTHRVTFRYTGFTGYPEAPRPGRPQPPDHRRHYPQARSAPKTPRERRPASRQPTISPADCRAQSRLHGSEHMKKRPWLTALLAPVILAVALLASNGHSVHLSHISRPAYIRLMADSGNGSGGGSCTVNVDCTINGGGGGGGGSGGTGGPGGGGGGNGSCNVTINIGCTINGGGGGGGGSGGAGGPGGGGGGSGSCNITINIGCTINPGNSGDSGTGGAGGAGGGGGGSGSCNVTVDVGCTTNSGDSGEDGGDDGD